MYAIRIVMGPVNDAAEIVPLVLTAKRDRTSALQIHDSWRNVYIVRDENRLARFQLDDEPLVPCTVRVVGQDSCDPTLASDEHIAAVVRERLLDRPVPGRRVGQLGRRLLVCRSQPDDRKNQDEGEDLCDPTPC